MRQGGRRHCWPALAKDKRMKLPLLPFTLSTGTALPSLGFCLLVVTNYAAWLLRILWSLQALGGLPRPGSGSKETNQSPSAWDTVCTLQAPEETTGSARQEDLPSVGWDGWSGGCPERKEASHWVTDSRPFLCLTL